MYELCSVGCVKKMAKGKPNKNIKLKNEKNKIKNPADRSSVKKN